MAKGTNNVLNMYIEDADSQRRVCDRWQLAVQERAERIASLNATYYHVMLPEKLSVLGDKLGWPIDHTRSRGSTFAQTAEGSVRQRIIDAVGYFRTLPNPERFFLRTDSHWTNVGAFVGYQLICSALKVEARNDLIRRPKKITELVFDLGSKLPNPTSETAAFAQFRKDAQIVNDEGLVRYKRASNLMNEGALHVGSKIEFENPQAKHDQTVILFGDSFCEYRDHLLTALIAETFRRVIFVWSTNIDYSICEKVRPDIVLCVMTERFMDRSPKDDFDVAEYTKNRIYEYERR